MIRTQVYLTEQQRAELATMAKTRGKKRSEIIRDAIDRFIEQEGRERRRTVLRQAAGMWKDRDDLPDFEDTRGKWNTG